MFGLTTLAVTVLFFISFKKYILNFEMSTTDSDCLSISFTLKYKAEVSLVAIAKTKSNAIIYIIKEINVIPLSQ